MKKSKLLLTFIMLIFATYIYAMPGAKKLEESTEEPCTQIIYVNMPVYVLGVYIGTTVVPVEVEIDCPD